MARREPRRVVTAVTLVVLCVLLGHDALMAAQGALPTPHHTAVAPDPEHTSPASHEAPVPHPEACDTALRAVAQPTSAPPPAALPCALPARQEPAVVRERPLRLDIPPTQPAATRRAVLQVYRL